MQVEDSLGARELVQAVDVLCGEEEALAQPLLDGRERSMPRVRSGFEELRAAAGEDAPEARGLVEQAVKRGEPLAVRLAQALVGGEAAEGGDAALGRCAGAGEDEQVRVVVELELFHETKRNTRETPPPDPCENPSPDPCETPPPGPCETPSPDPFPICRGEGEPSW